jgi:hypothetical protein
MRLPTWRSRPLALAKRSRPLAGPRRASLLPTAALAAALAAAGLLAAGRPALADGTQTGVIAGEVVDASHAGLEGVQVAISGPQIRRSGLTDAQGRFRFPALGLGVYQVTAELLNLKASAEDVEVFIGKTTEITLHLGEAALPATREVIQVSAEAPLIDRFETRSGGIVSFDFLDRLPVPRFYQSAAMLLPGVVDGGDGNPFASGALRNENVFLVDGVDTTDATTGLFGLNLPYEAVQEVSVTTAGAPVEYGRVSGAVINVVTRSGAQEYHGSGRFLATNNHWDSRYAYPPAAVQAIAPDVAATNATPNRVDPETALSLGGPLWKDRLWFFASYDNNGNTQLNPTQEGTLWDQAAEVNSGAFKLTAQLTPASTLVLQENVDSARLAAFTPFDRGFSENFVGRRPKPLRSAFVDRIPGDVFALQKESQRGDFSKLQWNTALAQSLSVELTLADQRRKLSRDPLNSHGITGDAPHQAIISTPTFFDSTLYNGLPDVGFDNRPRRQGNLSATWFLAAGPTDHQIKAGLDYQRNDSQRLFNFAGVRGVDPATGMATDGQLFVDQNLAPDCQLAACPPFDPATGQFVPFQLLNFWHRSPAATRATDAAGYLSDAVVFGRFLFSLGARYESQHADDRRGTTLISSRALAPRLGLTYDPLGDGKSLLTAFAGRYYEPFLQQYLDSFTQLDVFSGYSLYQWEAAPGCNPADVSSPCWMPEGAVGFFLTQIAAPNRALKPSYVDEVAFGFERQLTSSLALNLRFLDRRWRQLWNNVLAQSADAAGNPLVVSHLLNLPQARRRYQSEQIELQKRYSGHWQARASYTHSKAEGNLFRNDGADNFGNYLDSTNLNLVNRFGPAPYDRSHQLKIFSSAQFPFGRHNLSLGAAFVFESGLPFQREALDPGGLGVRFLTPRGSDRLPDVLQLDLGLGYEVRLTAGLDLELRGEVFNVTNQRRVLAVETLVDTGNFGQPRSLADLQAPRNYRLLLGLRF